MIEGDGYGERYAAYEGREESCKLPNIGHAVRQVGHAVQGSSLCSRTEMGQRKGNMAIRPTGWIDL